MALVLSALQFAPALGAGGDDEVCLSGEPITLPNGSIGCVADPEPVPESFRPPVARRLIPQSVGSPTVTCVGNGVEGNRIQPLYVVASDRTNRSAEVVPQIERWITEVDTIFSESSAGHDQDLVPRWVHDDQCVPEVETVVVPANADDSFYSTISALADAGYSDPGRHYLAWVDASLYCGIAVNYTDDSPGDSNRHNGRYPLWARVDAGCWGVDGMVEAHELLHMLGAVQKSAPRSTPYGHCTDEVDIMCYVDGPGVEMDMVCEDPETPYPIDCNKDDYFNPAPASGSYLDTHWNVARSDFLVNRSADPAAPQRPPAPEPAVGSAFADVPAGHPFEAEIEWLAGAGITKGCNPPTNDEFCPDVPVTRAQMAAFLGRGLELPASGSDHFGDDAGSRLEDYINRLAAAGITTGCGEGRFCPAGSATRGQMAAFLVRALDLPPTSTDYFADDEGSMFEDDINRLAAAGITTGCGPDRYCADTEVTRGQMAAFLRRALG